MGEGRKREMRRGRKGCGEVEGRGVKMDGEREGEGRVRGK